MVTSVAPGILVNAGHLMENLVFTALRRHSTDIFYYKTRSGLAVDFLVQNPDHSRLLVQVCDSMKDPPAKKREVAALSDAMSELGERQGIIVTRDEHDTIVAGGGTKEVFPAWRFLLRMDMGILVYWYIDDKLQKHTIYQAGNVIGTTPFEGKEGTLYFGCSGIIELQ